MTKAVFFLDVVTCRDEMGGWLREKAGNDEIYMAAIAIDSSGSAFKVPFFSVYEHFDDGDAKRYSPARPLVTINTIGSGSVMLLLAEKQHGGMNKALDEAYNKAVLTMAQQKADGQGVSEPTGSLKWEVIVEIAKSIGAYVIKEANDKVFPPHVVGLEPRAGVVQFRGHDGVYDVNYHWAVA